MTQGVGCCESEGNVRQRSQPPVPQTRGPRQPCTASTVSSAGKAQLQQGHRLQNQAAATPNLATGATALRFSVPPGTFSSDVYTGPSVQWFPVHRFPVPIPWPESGGGKWLFVFEGEKLWSPARIPQPRFQSLLPVTLTLPG